MKSHNYFVYMVTNKTKKVLYVGMTNNLAERVVEHYLNQGNKKTFTGRYNCFNLVFFERYQYVNMAIEREKELKGWKRIKKDDLVNSFNPKWEFLNQEVCGIWPPENSNRRYD